MYFQLPCLGKSEDIENMKIQKYKKNAKMGNTKNKTVQKYNKKKNNAKMGNRLIVYCDSWSRSSAGRSCRASPGNRDYWFSSRWPHIRIYTGHWTLDTGHWVKRQWYCQNILAKLCVVMLNQPVRSGTVTEPFWVIHHTGNVRWWPLEAWWNNSPIYFMNQKPIVDTNCFLREN